MSKSRSGSSGSSRSKDAKRLDAYDALEAREAARRAANRFRVELSINGGVLGDVSRPTVAPLGVISAAEEWDRAILYDLFVCLTKRRNGMTDRSEWEILERAEALLKKWRKRG
jgi:hypothetical protein